MEGTYVLFSTEWNKAEHADVFCGFKMLFSIMDPFDETNDISYKSRNAVILFIH